MFNMTYDVKELESVKACSYCYTLWEATKKVKDSRDITQRIEDLLGRM